MPATRPRRLDVQVGQSLHDRASALPLSSIGWRSHADRVERERPELIVERDGNILYAHIAGPTAGLSYGFASDRAFTDLFPAMLRQLEPRLRDGGAETVRFRLMHNPSRPIVEPVLKNLWFAPAGGRLDFSFERSQPLPAAPAPKGIRFREGSAVDADAIAVVDRQAFPRSPMPAEGLRARLIAGQTVELASNRDGLSGFCISSMPEETNGYIHVLAVAEAQRGRGLGAALTARALRRLFRAGAKSVALTTDDDNATAISLYVKLGFRQTRAGREYRKPLDARVLAELKRKKQGTLIKFGGWR